MGEKSIFGLDPDQVERLLSIGTEGADGSDSDSEKSRPADEAPPDGKSKAPSPTPSMSAIIEKPGGQVGPYKLVSILGEGGFAVVYLAEQQEPVKRRVALKIIKPGMDSKQVIARFEAERQALALLDHPNVAHVYDAGTTELGRPYFAMEYVKGVPITEHCDRHKLTIEERLKLFLQVCEAVQHAHQKGIIHRDIKPSNILVLFEGQRALPKVIDFGIAKAVSQPLTERTLYTEQGQLVGTPEYMSPEQAEMTSQDIDTRSDIYSLGVLLYELMTGVLPFEAEELRKGGLDYIRTVIREQEPKTPSTRLSKLTREESTKLAQHRRAEPDVLRRRLRGDLDWITLKAMEKDRTRRYGSAGELFADIQHHLSHEPVAAGPPSTIYRAKKFVRRNRALVTGIAAVLFVLIAGVMVSTIFAIRAERARAEAQLIADFLQNDVLGSAEKARVGEATVSYILDAASKNLEAKFKDRPLVEASIQRRLGGTYRAIGEVEKAEQHFLRAIEIYRQHHGEEHPDTLEATDAIGWVYEDQGRYDDMEHLWTKNRKIRQRVSGVELQVGTMNGLAMAYYYLGKYKEAESLFDKILQTVRHELGEENVAHLPFYKCNLAGVYAAQGRYKEAKRLFVETLDEWREKTSNWEFFYTNWEFYYTSALANMYREQGLYKEAEPLFVKALENQRQQLGDKHFHTLLSMYGLARLYIDQDRLDDAKTLFSEALPIARERLRKEHPLTLRFVNAYAVLHTKQKHYDEAETLFDEALKGRKRELGDDHPYTLETKNDLAMLYKEQGRHDEAEPLLVEAVKGRRLKLGEKHPHTQESLNNLIELYEAWGKPEEAEKWRAELPRNESTDHQ